MFYAAYQGLNDRQLQCATWPAISVACATGLSPAARPARQPDASRVPVEVFLRSHDRPDDLGLVTQLSRQKFVVVIVGPPNPETRLLPHSSSCAVRVCPACRSRRAR